MTDKSKRSEAPEKGEAPTPTIAPAIDPRTGGRGTKVAIVDVRAVGSIITHASMVQDIARHCAVFDINESRVRAEALDIA